MVLEMEFWPENLNYSKVPALIPEAEVCKGDTSTAQRLAKQIPLPGGAAALGLQLGLVLWYLVCPGLVK